MCLEIVYRGKQKKEALAKLPESGYYWKSVRYDGVEYSPGIRRHKPAFVAGWNETRGCYLGEGYNIAFHLYKNKREADWWTRHDVNGRRTIRCKVNKKDIVAIGEQHGLCIVTTRFWCPKPK